MIRLNVFLQTTPEQRETLLTAAKELAAQSNQEKGCIAYDVFESSTRADVLMICETWADDAALEQHQLSEHFKALSPVLHKLAEMKTEKFHF